MRAFLWAVLGKDCIRTRQYRTESDVIQDTLFGFFLQKGGLKCDSVKQENDSETFQKVGFWNSISAAFDKPIRVVVRTKLVIFNSKLIKACRDYMSTLT